MRNKIPLLLLAMLSVLALGGLVLSLSEVQPNRHVTATFCGQTGSAPRTIVVTCADANYGFTNLAWEQWGNPVTYGHGIKYVNDCTPTCAAGTFKKTTVTIELYNLRNNRYTTLNGVGFNAGMDNKPIQLG